MDYRTNSRGRMFLAAAQSVVLFAAALSVACGHKDLAQEGSVEKSSTAIKAQLGDRVDETLDWNEHLIDALFTAGTSPPPALRVAAIMNVAVFDAENGVYRQFHPIHFDRVAPRGTSRWAAVIGAAYTTLSKLFPTQQSKFDADEAASLAAMTDDEDDDGSGQSTSLGLAWGTTVANDILAWRATDGFTTVYSPFTGGTAVGQWRPTPPAFAPMALQQFSFMKTFAVASAQQFVAPKTARHRHCPMGLRLQRGEVDRLPDRLSPYRRPDGHRLVLRRRRLGPLE